MTLTHDGQADAADGPVAGRRELLAERLAGGGTHIAPVSAAQRRLWFADQLRPGRADYTVVWPMRLTGVLDGAALATALSELVARHEVLRTRFVGIDGEPVQVIAPAASVDCPVVDLTGLPEPRRAAEVRERCRLAGTRPFDLATGPLFVAELVREHEERHVLVLTVHHIVFDGWSWSVLLRDLSELYRAALAGDGTTLPPLPVQYADYAAWEQEWLAGELLAEHIEFWRAHLSGAPEEIDLPADLDPGTGGRSGAGARIPVAVPPDTTAALAALCAERGASRFMGVLAAMNVVLGRYGGTDDVVVGTLTANRAQPELEDLIGFFVNTLPVRVDLSGDPTFRELLTRTRTAALAAFAHQELPFDRLVEELAPRRRAGAMPYVRAALVLQDGSEQPATLGPLAVESLATETRTATFDLSLQFAPDGGGLRGFVEYATDVFGAGTALRFASHVLHVLEQAVAAPDRPISANGLLTGDERVVALAEAVAPRGPHQDAGLHELVAAQAARTPDAVAVRCDGETLTYAELDLAANRVATRLLAEGVGPERLVGVCVRRSLWSVTALLGVLKAGAAYLPLEPDNPADRLAYLIADSGADTVVVERDLTGLLPTDGFTVVPLEEALTTQAGPLPPTGGGPDALAYVIYTSGSTGLPKGVAVSHRAAVTRVHDPAYVSLTERDVMLHALALSFDVSVLEVFGALTNGCELAVLSGKAMPERVGEFVAEHGVTVCWLTAALFHAVVDTAPGSLAGVRTLIAGGDQLSTSHTERALAVLGADAVLVNGYGPTEAAIFASTHPMRPADGVRGRVPIGTAIPDTELFVLDRDGQLLPAGVPGELYIGGPCLARGYLGRPDLTATRFVPSPFGAEGARLYRTGDLVRRTADGLIEFLGRTDHQVKVRGFRVELGEIEQVLRRHPGVGDAVVVAPADDRAERTVVGYVESLAGRPPSVSELLDHCRAALPGYMVPALLVVLDALPLNPNGKVDRAALPDPGGVRPELRTGYVPARTPIEETLVSVWCEVLGLDRVGVHDDFFDLGGHSLLASRLLARVRRTFECELALSVFFAGPTVAELATALDEARVEPSVARPPLLPLDPLPDPLPASLGQRRLWFAHELDPTSVDYTIVWPVRLTGPLDVAALRLAVAGVVARHDVLRTRFASIDGEPVQIVDPATGIECPLTDLYTEPRHERTGLLRARIAAAGAHRFDLAAGPLFLAELVRVAPEEHVLVISVHHIVYDGWSSSVLLRDLAELYAGFADDGGTDLPPLPVQYADYSVWERSWLTGPALDEQLGYWRDQLAGAPEVAELPADFAPGAQGRSGAGARQEISLPAGVGTALTRFCAQSGATPFMGLLAALGIVLGRYGGTDDVVVGTYSANRGRPELEELVGFFVNTLALRVDVSGDPTFRELVARARAASLGAFAHQDVPFDRVVEELAPRRRAGVTPYVQVALVMQNLPVEAATFGAATVESLPSDTRSATFDISLHVWPDHDGGFGGFVEYATDVFTERTAARFGEHVRWVLEQSLTDPDAPVGRHALATPVERHALLDRAVGPLARFGEEAPADRVLRQAAMTPGAAAFIADDVVLTYAALVDRSAVLAARLTAAGVGQEDPVGVCLPRGLELPVAALAVWRAGGAYLPLDPESPPARLAHLLRDSGAAVVVTDASGADLVPPGTTRILLDQVDWAGAPAKMTVPAGGIDRLAAVIYTSGSTGRPKGVAITGRSLLNRLDWMAGEWPFQPDEVACQKGPIGFVDGLWELLGGLLHGVPTVVAPPEAGVDPLALTTLLAHHRVTRLLLVPSLLHALLDLPDLADRLPALRLWISSGEELAPNLVRQFTELLAGRELRNLYGSSEAWDSLCQRKTHEVSEVSEVSVGRPVPVGEPISNVRAYLLDDELRPVPVGVTGDLYLGGACLARGYLGQPALTAERFLPDPFDAAGGRIYRSGDRAVRRADGQLELAGRADFQLKIRGIRVEPAEVERALEEQPGVRHAVVTGWRRAGGTELAAYLVPEQDVPLDDRVLRAELGRVLPRHLVPTAFTVLTEFPLNSSGKVDRLALPAPDPRSTAAPVATDDATTEDERAVRAIWAELLGLDTVGVHDDFFDLGGHSLLAMQLVDRLAHLLGTRLGVRAVFENPTVHMLSRELSAMRDRTTTAWRA